LAPGATIIRREGSLWKGTEEQVEGTERGEKNVKRHSNGSIVRKKEKYKKKVIRGRSCKIISWVGDLGE